MAELADAPDLGSGGAILVGSSPSPGTIVNQLLTHAIQGGVSDRGASSNIGFNS